MIVVSDAAGGTGSLVELLGRAGGESPSPAALDAQEMVGATAMVAAAYGAKVDGMPHHLLGRLRRTGRAGTAAKARGSSATIDLMLQQVRRLGLTFRANADPLDRAGATVATLRRM